MYRKSRMSVSAVSANRPRIVSTKDNTHKVNQIIYENLLALKLVYPMCQRLNSVFSPTMFNQISKGMIEDIIYYAIKIIDGDFLMNIEWPPLTTSAVAKFRTAVVKYFEGFYVKYGVSLPRLLKSNLVTPNDKRLSMFLLELSKFVMFKCVEQYSHTLVLNTHMKERSIIHKFKSAIETENKKISQEIQCCVEQARKRAQAVLDREREQASRFEIADEKLVNLNDDNSNQNDDSLSIVFPHRDELKRKAKECREIIDLYVNQNNCIEYKKGDIENTESEELDFHHILSISRMHIADQELSFIRNGEKDEDEMLNTAKKNLQSLEMIADTMASTQKDYLAVMEELGRKSKE